MLQTVQLPGALCLHRTGDVRFEQVNMRMRVESLRAFSHGSLLSYVTVLCYHDMALRCYLLA